MGYLLARLDIPIVAMALGPDHMSEPAAYVPRLVGILMVGLRGLLLVQANPGDRTAAIQRSGSSVRRLALGAVAGARGGAADLLGSAGPLGS